MLTLASRNESGSFNEHPSLSLLQRSNLSGETGDCNGLEKFTECQMHYLGHYYRKVLHKLPIVPNRKDLLHLFLTNERPSECHTAGKTSRRLFMSTQQGRFIETRVDPFSLMTSIIRT